MKKQMLRWIGKTNHAIRKSLTLLWLVEMYMSQFMVVCQVFRVFLIIGFPVTYLMTDTVYDAIILYVGINIFYAIFLFYSLFICLAIADGAC